MDLTLSDYPFKPNFMEIGGIRVHFIDEGNPKAPAILFLHGVPTWSYSFRNIIPICLQNGYRVIAPDLPGFGKSDKPQTKKIYTLENLVDWKETFIRKIECDKLFLFGHDWGAVTGMAIAAGNPDLFSGIIVCNGFLPEGRRKLPPLLRFWKWFAKYSPCIPVGMIINYGCKRRLSHLDRTGFNFPFSSEKEKTAIRQIPQLIPTGRNDSPMSLYSVFWYQLAHLQIPFLTVFSSNDPITRGGEKVLQAHIPGAKNQPHRILEGKHFLQEDQPEELGIIICEFVKRNV